MRKRRFLLLAASLVALNAALWLVPQGFAQSAVSTLFGKNMVRAEVIENTGADWHLDRGIVVSNVSTVLGQELTLREADTKSQTITLSSATKVTGVGKAVGITGIKAGWRVLVTWPGPDGPAQSVVIEKRGKNASVSSVSASSTH